MEAPNLIRTQHRYKIPQGWTYPLGAEIVSQALRGVPQYEQIHLDFLGSTWNATQSDDYQVLSGDHTDPDATMMTRNWRVAVSAVPHVVAPKVKELLLQEGLPRIRAWLEEPRTSIWYWGRKQIHIQFRIAEHSLSVVEYSYRR